MLYDTAAETAVGGSMMRPRSVPTPAEERAFIASVLYASIFDYPLTADQLHETLIGVRANPGVARAWYEASAVLQSAIEHHDGSFFPRGRRDLIELRRQREAISKSMLRDLRRPLSVVTHMPFVRMVAVSGSLAHLNADGEADLDLFVITRGGRVWSVMTTVLVLSRVFGWRRRLCVNYIISERQLAVEPCDLFSANQIVHLRPLSGGDIYHRFLEANRFVTTIYPNFTPRHVESTCIKWWMRTAERLLDWTVAPLYERLCRRAYSWHLHRRAHAWPSRDQVRLEPECLKLHTNSHRQAVLERFACAVADTERDLSCGLGVDARAIV